MVTGNMHKKFGKVQLCGLRVMRADRLKNQTETHRQTDRHTHHSTSTHPQGKVTVIIIRLLITCSSEDSSNTIITCEANTNDSNNSQLHNNVMASAAVNIKDNFCNNKKTFSHSTG